MSTNSRADSPAGSATAAWAAGGNIAPGLPSKILSITATLGTVKATALTVVAVAVGRMVDAIIGGTGPTAGQWWVAGIACAVIAVAQAAMTNLQARAWAINETHQRARLTRHLLGAGFAPVTRLGTAPLATLLAAGVAKHTEYRVNFFGPAAGAIASPLVALAIFAVTVDPVTAGWLLALLPAPVLIIGAASGFTRKSPEAQRKAEAVYANRFLDSVRGLTSLRLLGAHHRRARTLADDGELVRRRVMEVLWANQLTTLLLYFTFSLFLLGGAGYLAASGLSDGRLTAGGALAVVAISLIVLEPIEFVGAFFYIGMGGRAAENHMREVLALPSGRIDWPTTDGDADCGCPQSLQLRHINFAYAEDEPVLDDVSLDLPTGTTTTLMGPSGGGKSTVLSLVQGLITPDDGQILRASGTEEQRPADCGDGDGWVPADPEWLRRHTALVGQGAQLLRGSVADNLRLGNPDATDDELWDALRRVHLDAEITDLDMAVGELGHGVSGGQAQRLAIARVILADRPILLLDEPTSSLDGPTQKAVLEALAEATRGRTVLTVNHRPDGTADGARIVRLTEGSLR